MTVGGSIRNRLVLGAAVMLLVFLAVAAAALERAHGNAIRESHHARLQSTVYLLLAGAELEADGTLVMPHSPVEPRLSLPGSGLYASILQVDSGQVWQSASSVGRSPPFAREAAVGQWRFGTAEAGGTGYLAATYGVRWAGRGEQQATLVLSVLEDRVALDREARTFRSTLWRWLGGAAVLLLLTQTLLLQWALSPLQRVAREIQRIDRGEQAEVQGRYPAELTPLTDNLNTLMRQERLRQQRYREALSFLAHSLKTPLAVLRTALARPQELPQAVVQQVDRMDEIVQHQLGRAAAGGATRFAPLLDVPAAAQRVLDSLAKVHAARQVTFTLDAPAGLRWRIDEGDAFELLGNLLDNAAKWARTRVAAQLRIDPQGTLVLQVDDDGPGFSDTESVLQIGVRGDERVPGHGVGLAIVNDLVASHHGRLALGRSDWGGARVSVQLPPG